MSSAGYINIVNNNNTNVQVAFGILYIKRFDWLRLTWFIFNSPTHPTPLNSLFRIHLVCNELHMGRMRNFTAKPETVDRHYVHS